jgi:hypothetical protein
MFLTCMEAAARIEGLVDIVSERARRRRKEVQNCHSDRSKKHMLIRADEAGQIVALLRAALAGAKTNEQ